MSDNSPVIETHQLTRRFRRLDAVHELDLTVRQGSIHAFLGPNGAGKTTTIRMLLNILRPNSGEATILGVSSKKLGRRDFEKIGYVSENQQLPVWMTVSQLMNYLRPLYPTWDSDFEQKLLHDFELPADQKLKHLSRGMRMKAALVGALAFRPRLLVLDEPFAGLDPLVREEFLEGLIELTEQEQWTIFISSHDIDEVERLADEVSLINHGRLMLSESVESLLNRFRRISFTRSIENGSMDDASQDWMNLQQSGNRVSFVESKFDPNETEANIRKQFDATQDITIEKLTLKEIYLTLARHLKNLQPSTH